MLSGYGNWVQVITSRGVKVAGLLGPAAAMEKKSSNVADTPVGIGGTNQWKLAGLVGANHITLMHFSAMQGSCHLREEPRGNGWPSPRATDFYREA